MRLVIFREGSFFTIWALDLSVHPDPEDCPAKSFFAALERSSQRTLTNLLTRHADKGAIKNDKKSRHLGDGIYEFKTTQGDRLLYFYDGLGTTILTHGFQKGAQVQAEIKKAKDLRAKWRSSPGGKNFRDSLEGRSRTR